jgi:site-specific recombinase XerD
MAADFSKATKKGDRYVYQGKSQKTGEPFYLVLMPDAVKILERYGWVLPKMSTEQYNLRLKVVADAAGVDKPISSHYARHTAAMYFINEGMPIEVVSKVLGHASIKTTESVYAKIINETVDKEFDKLINKGKGM